MKHWLFNLIRAWTFTVAIAAVGYAEAELSAGESPLTGQEAVARMEAARNQVANVRSNIFITLVELDKVRGAHDPANPQFQVFTNQLARMEELAKAFANRAEEMRQRGKAYFTDWEARTAAIQDPDKRRAAEKRYGERKASYDSINKSMQEAKKNFMPFVAELGEIKTLFEGKHDEQSIARARDLFMRANWHCIDVQRSLMEMEAQFDQLAVSFGEKN
jgi:hypothetical protein